MGNEFCIGSVGTQRFKKVFCTVVLMNWKNRFGPVQRENPLVYSIGKLVAIYIKYLGGLSRSETSWNKPYFMISRPERLTFANHWCARSEAFSTQILARMIFWEPGTDRGWQTSDPGRPMEDSIMYLSTSNLVYSRQAGSYTETLITDL